MSGGGGGGQPAHPDTGLGLPVQLPRRASAYDVFVTPGSSGLNAMAIAAAQQRASISAQGGLRDLRTNRYVYASDLHTSRSFSQRLLARARALRLETTSRAPRKLFISRIIRTRTRDVRTGVSAGNKCKIDEYSQTCDIRRYFSERMFFFDAKKVYGARMPDLTAKHRAWGILV